MHQLRITIVFLLVALQMAAQKSDFNYGKLPIDLLGNADEIIRLEKTELDVMTTASAKLSYTKIVTILNDASRENNVVIYYDADCKIGKVTASIYDQFGTFVRKVKKSELSDYSAVSGGTLYSDTRVKHVELTYNGYPYTVKYEYEMTLTGGFLLSYMNWSIQGYDQAIQNAEYVLSAPVDFVFDYRASNIDIEPDITTAKNVKTYKWTVSNLEAIEYQSYAPAPAKVLPALRISPGQFEWDGYEFSMTNWDSFGELMSTLFSGRDILTPELQAEVQSLTKDATTDAEKIEILYDYLKKNMRYVSVQLGIGGWQPFDAKYVFENKYGDCKALSNFMKAMLKEVGITAYPVLTYLGDLNYEASEDFTTIAFNHMILNVPSEDIWLECTSSNYPVNYIGPSNEDRNVYLIKENGGELARTPKLPIEANYKNRKATIAIAADGSAQLKGEELCGGNQHTHVRQMIYYQSEEENRKLFQKEVSLPSFTFNDFQLQAEDKEPLSLVTYDLSVPRYASKAGKRLFIPINSIGAMKNVPEAMENRIHRIVKKQGYIEKDEITFEIPEGYKVESIGTNAKEMSTEFGDYKISIEDKGAQLIYTRIFRSKPINLPAEKYEDFRNFYKEIAKSDKMKVVLVEQKT